jgi:hypothetical protein
MSEKRDLLRFSPVFGRGNPGGEKLKNLSRCVPLAKTGNLTASVRHERNTMPDEIPATEVPPPAAVPPENPPAENLPPAAPPPAASLVLEGEVTDERALALARRERELAEREARLRGEETTLAERERKIQEREQVLAQPPAPAKTKRKRNFSDPFFCPEEIEE